MGTSGTGKTSLVVRFTEDKFAGNNVQSTMKAAFRDATIHDAASHTKMEVQLWDTAGEERFRSTQRGFYRDVAAAMVVFSVDDPDSLTATKLWIEDVRRENSDVVLVLVANKCDIEHREVPADRARAMADEISAELGKEVPLLETSAKTGDGVAAAFTSLMQQIQRSVRDDGAAAGVGGASDASRA